MLLASRVLTCWSFQLQMVSWFEAAGSNGHQTTGQVSEEQLCISDEPSLLCLWIQGPRTRRDDQPMGCESWILHVGIRWHRHFEDPWFAILPNPPQHWTRAFPVNLHPNIELVLFQWASATLDESKVGGFKYFLNIFQLVSLGGSQSKISRYKTGHWVTNDCRMICFFSSSGSSCCIGTKSIQQNPTRRPWWPLMWALASISVWLPLGREKVRKSFERPGNV